MPGHYKLICIDLDGTLLNSRGELSDYSINVLNKAREKGAIVCFTSGRPYFHIMPFVKILGLDTPMVAFNGAHIFDPVKNEFWRREDLPVEETLKFMKFCDENGFFWHVYGHYSVGSRNDTPQFSRHKRFYDLYGQLGLELPDRYLLNTEQECIDYLNKGCGKISVRTDKEGMDVIADYFKTPRPGMVCKKSASVLMEAMNEKASKWDAIKIMAERLGVPEDQICVFGDNMNDLEMIQGCKTSFAMKNGDERIFPYATRVISTNNEDGVAHAIEDYIMDNIIS